jgi:2-polyprenyl-6-methoxyphenol hydroxylase-like FAD-dependent oxidoreductase
VSEMTTPSNRDTDVLIVGAGPTGLVLGLWLTRLGVRVRIVDKTTEPGMTSRALAVQARTLELYSQAGLAEAVVERGRRVVAVNLWVAGKKAAHAVFGDLGAGLSPFPYALVFPQAEHERLLIERLAEAGIEVERRTELLGFEDRADGLLARLKRPDGAEEECAASYIAGCDGGRSTVREALQIGFPGGQYAHLFYVADVEASGATMNGELHVALDPTDFLAVFPLKGDGCARLVGTVREEAEHQHEDLSWNDVSKRVIESMRIDVKRVNWFSTYRVHHRVANNFRRGRAFLLGDSAHIHSPVGGQGMNTGIGDAVNLAWKLAAVLHQRAKRVDPGQLRTGTNRFRPPPGRYDGSRLHRSDQPQRVRAAGAATNRAADLPAPLQIREGETPAVSYGLTNGRELSRKQSKRRARGRGSRRRPLAVGKDRRERRRRGQLQAVDFDGLADPRIRRSHARARHAVWRAKVSPSRFCMAIRNGPRWTRAQRSLSHKA